MVPPPSHGGFSSRSARRNSAESSDRREIPCAPCRDALLAWEGYDEAPLCRDTAYPSTKCFRCDSAGIDCVPSYDVEAKAQQLNKLLENATSMVTDIKSTLDDIKKGSTRYTSGVAAAQTAEAEREISSTRRFALAERQVVALEALVATTERLTAAIERQSSDISSIKRTLLESHQ